MMSRTAEAAGTQRLNSPLATENSTAAPAKTRKTKGCSCGQPPAQPPAQPRTVA